MTSSATVNMLARQHRGIAGYSAVLSDHQHQHDNFVSPVDSRYERGVVEPVITIDHRGIRNCGADGAIQRKSARWSPIWLRSVTTILELHFCLSSTRARV